MHTFTEKEGGIPPAFATPMTITYTPEEQKATLRCQITGTPTPQVQWFKGNEPVVASETVLPQFDDETGECILELLQPVANETIVYSVQAHNEFGRAVGRAQLYVETPEIVHDQTTVTVVKKPPIAQKAPRVTPLDARILKTGETLVFTSKYQGTPEPSIQWLRNGKAIEPNDDVTFRTENLQSTITVRNMTRKRVGKYEIVATNEAGEARSSGSVVVSDTSSPEELRAPRFIEPLQPKTVLEQDVVILEATVDSYPNSSFQWFYNSAPIAQTASVRLVTKENKSVLIVESFVRQHSGLYTCRAENVAGSVTSTASVQIVEEESQLEEVYEMLSPRFTQRLQPVQLMDGEELVLPCQVIGHPTPKIQWYRNKEPLQNTPGIAISQETNGQCLLTIAEVFPEDAGEYTCQAVNKIGDASSTVSVIVEGTDTTEIYDARTQIHNNCHFTISLRCLSHKSANSIPTIVFMPHFWSPLFSVLLTIFLAYIYVLIPNPRFA